MTAATEPPRGVAGWRPTVVLARAFDITPGQAATMVVTLAIAVVLTIGGLPPVLRRGGAAEVAVQRQPAPATPEVASSPTPETPALPAPTTGAAPDASFSGGFTDSGTDSGTSGYSFEPSYEASRGAPAPATGTTARFASVGSPGAPEGLAVADDGTVYVATNNGTAQGEAGPSKILTFDPAGAPKRSFTIAGQPTNHALGLTGLALDGEDALVALDAGTDRVLRIDLRSGRQSTLATLIDLPACGLVVAAPSGCEPGVEDQEPEPRGVALDRSRNLYVTDATQGVVWRVPAGGGAPRAWAASTTFGSGNGLAGVAIDAKGAVLVASPQALDPAAALSGAVYRIPVDDAGKAASPELVVFFRPGDEPAGITSLPDGSIVAALRGVKAVVLVGPDGKEVRRVTSADVDAPTGVAFQGETLLVTNQAPATKAAWAVLAVGIR